MDDMQYQVHVLSGEPVLDSDPAREDLSETSSDRTLAMG